MGATVLDRHPLQFSSAVYTASISWFIFWCYTNVGGLQMRLRKHQTEGADKVILLYLLGRFGLGTGNATTIFISNTNTDGYVVVNAVQLVP